MGGVPMRNSFRSAQCAVVVSRSNRRSFIRNFWSLVIPLNADPLLLLLLLLLLAPAEVEGEAEAAAAVAATDPPPTAAPVFPSAGDTEAPESFVEVAEVAWDAPDEGVGGEVVEDDDGGVVVGGFSSSRRGAVREKARGNCDVELRKGRSCRKDRTSGLATLWQLDMAAAVVGVRGWKVGGVIYVVVEMEV